MAERRTWSRGEKIQLVQESAVPGVVITQFARSRGIQPSLLFRWRRMLAQEGIAAPPSEADILPTTAVRELHERIIDLERLLGKKTLENERLREALEKSRETRQQTRAFQERMRPG